MENLDILMICFNNEMYFQHIFPLIHRKIKSVSVNWYVYENNSTDRTLEMLEELDRKLSNFTLISQKTLRYQNKYINIMLARKFLTNWYFQNVMNTNKWVIWLDTNILFNDKSIIALLDSSRRNPDGKMFTSFTDYLHNSSCKYYYDILAYNYGKFFRTTKSPSITWRDICADNFSLNEEGRIDQNLESKILTGFGGLALVCRESLGKINWKLHRCLSVSNLGIPPVIVCEHWSFQEQLRSIGNIYMVKNTGTLWFMDNIFQDMEKIKNIKKKLDSV